MSADLDPEHDTPAEADPGPHAPPSPPGEPAVVEPLGTCEDGHGPVIVVHDLDGTHMGYALAMLKARWTRDRDTARLALDLVGRAELLRSGLELALSLALTDAASSREASPGDVPGDATDAAAGLRRLAGTQRRRGRARLNRLCLELAAALDEEPEHTSVRVHQVDIDTVLTLCAALCAGIEVRHGLSVADLFTRYEQMLALTAQTPPA